MLLDYNLLLQISEEICNKQHIPEIQCISLPTRAYEILMKSGIEMIYDSTNDIHYINDYNNSNRIYIMHNYLLDENAMLVKWSNNRIETIKIEY